MDIINCISSSSFEHSIEITESNSNSHSSPAGSENNSATGSENSESEVPSKARASQSSKPEMERFPGQEDTPGLSKVFLIVFKIFLLMRAFILFLQV